MTQPDLVEIVAEWLFLEDWHKEVKYASWANVGEWSEISGDIKVIYRDSARSLLRRLGEADVVRKDENQTVPENPWGDFSMWQQGRRAYGECQKEMLKTGFVRVRPLLDGEK